MYNYEIKPNLQKILNKLSKKDKISYEHILKKIEEIINAYDIEHYKNLKYDLRAFKGVHIGHFVLVFSFDESRNLISFVDFDHHDVIYKKKI